MFTKDLDAAVHAVRVLVADLDPDAIPLCEVLDAWKKFNAIERDAISAKTLLARRVEDGNTWRSAGYRSAAAQLAVLAGTSVNNEKKAIETSKKVKKLPKTAAAMRKGSCRPRRRSRSRVRRRLRLTRKTSCWTVRRRSRWPRCARSA